jgi:hypothetical protein
VHKATSFIDNASPRHSTSSLEFTGAPLTPHQILVACSRLAALIWGIYTISHMPEFLVHMNSPAVDNRTSLAVITAIQLSVCAYLWFFPTTVARVLLPAKFAAPSFPSHLKDWQMLGVVLIGLWEAAQALPRLVFWAVVINTPIGGDYSYNSLTPVQRGQLLWTLLQLATGIWLMFRARNIAAFLFGTRKGEPPG